MTTPSTLSLGYAGPGAVNQHGGNLPVRLCSRCSAQIVWVKSARTGRHYPVNVRRGQADQRYYMGHDLHPRDCAERKAADLAEYIADEDRRRDNAAAADELLAARRTYNAEHAAATTDAERTAADNRLLAAMDAITDKYDAIDRDRRRSLATRKDPS